ncbi:MAG: phosphoribosylanthranilate isomerase [Leptolyngbya sp. PLA2]|nr:phosphoribosylanthranilate isomerase [Leptolyngbya sp.]MCE7971185.1 phosphoribosylanthranilate isomerase [Leptolyngbya sp. PL-A2]MCQ3940864.1 N-(5'-phosphoribosyl)anthranilate isomerase [cyanobacterium CYA1]MCZ7634114.1 phosphoribosylanthranilate isomerase [Phycisphaerales bacterium]MDL1905178.1 phosphoribosylanthranilate isomerase [Synechococcales cyanobacterium CNB]GIK19272.1 MAG: N-(5'-phosphoribosyl)anthranilate isomerase [Planctomycetota bacterium]
MPRTRVKVCGIRDLDAALAAAEAGSDAIGFVFVRGTPRYIAPDEAFEIMSCLPPMVGTVAVLRDSTIDEFLEIEQQCPTAWTQLHGSEPESLVRDCGPGVIRAVRFRADTIERDLKRWDAVEEVDAILVDGSAGGTGEAFDWNALAPHMRSVRKPVIIAGGLTPENVGEAITACRPYAVDVSSGVESSPGVKDHAKIAAFCRAVRRADAALFG